MSSSSDIDTETLKATRAFMVAVANRYDLAGSAAVRVGLTGPTAMQMWPSCFTVIRANSWRPNWTWMTLLTMSFWTPASESSRCPYGKRNGTTRRRTRTRDCSITSNTTGFGCERPGLDGEGYPSPARASIHGLLPRFKTIFRTPRCPHSIAPACGQ